MPQQLRTSLLQPIKDSWTVGLGYIPLGLAFGVLVSQSGFAWFWAPFISLCLYAGSSEFLAVGLLLSGAPVLTSAFTSFVVNFRHVFYGLTYPTRLIKRRLARAYSMYALTDEAYAIGSTIAAKDPGRLHGRYLMLQQLFLHVMWVGSSTVGALTGAALPPGLKGVEFALVALFAVLAIEAFKANRDFSLPVVACCCAGIGLLFFGGEMLIAALLLYVAHLLLRHFSPRVDLLLTWKRQGDK